MALHMLLQMRRLLEPRAALLAIMADPLARRATATATTTTYVVLIQATRFVLMVLEDVVSDQPLLRAHDAAELALVPPDVPHRGGRRRGHCRSEDAATVRICFTHLVSDRGGTRRISQNRERVVGTREARGGAVEEEEPSSTPPEWRGG